MKHYLKQAVDAVPYFTPEKIVEFVKKEKMKTPKEKAKELIDKFTVVGLQQRNEGIACALICVDEILNSNNEFLQTFLQYEYWLKVKSEIEKL